MTLQRREGALPRIPAPLKGAYQGARAVLSMAPRLRGCTILVGVSGGPDSSLLVHVMALLAPRMGFSVQAVHVNHGLSSSSPLLQQSAERACAAAQVPLHVVSVVVPLKSGEGPEGAARTVRRAAVMTHATNIGAAWIATGHTASDVAETFLQRILEGAGRGQAALPALDPPFIRPLHTLTRSEVRTAVQAANLPAMEDPMNSDPTLLRTFLRTRVLPVLEERFSAPERALARAAQLAGQDGMALESLVPECAASDGLARNAAVTLPAPVLARLLRRWVEEVAGGPVRTGSQAVDKAVRAAKANGGPQRCFKAGPVWIVVDAVRVRVVDKLGSETAQDI